VEPLDWVALLLDRLVRRRDRIRRNDDYYRGAHPLLFASERFQQAFGGRFSAFSDNWCSLVVDVVLERLHVRGFRFADNEEDDLDAWAIWQGSGLDARADLALKEALICGQSYLLVWPGDPLPRISAEHPEEVIVAHDPADSEQRLAALKFWTRDGLDHATLFLPEGVWKYQRRSVLAHPLIALPAGARDLLPSWVPRRVEGEDWPAPNPMGVVPVVPLINRPRLLPPRRRASPDGRPAWREDSFLGDGETEFAEIMGLQDSVNKTLMDALVGSEFMALPQRWVTGFEVERDPATGNVRQPWDVGADRVLWQRSADAKFGQFSAADLTNYVKLIEMEVQHIASISRTPPHYFGQISGQFPSGESLKSAEAGLVAKAREKQVHFGEGLEEAVRLAFLAQGDERGLRRDAETIWGDPESRTEGEHIDALLKQATLGVPLEFLWEKAGYSPQEIRRIHALREEALLRDASLLAAGERDALPGAGVATAAEEADDVLKKANAVGVLIRAGYLPDDALRAVGLDPMRHSGLVPITVQSPDAAAE